MTAKQRTGRVLIAVFAATMLVATACTPGGPTASPGPTGTAAASATAKPDQGGRIIEGWISDLATIQPVLSNDTTSARAWGLNYDGILQVDPKSGEPKARMATYSVSSDGLTYTFEMNARANWSDGKPVIAQDWLTGLQGVAQVGEDRSQVDVPGHRRLQRLLHRHLRNAVQADRRRRRRSPASRSTARTRRSGRSR